MFLFTNSRRSHTCPYDRDHFADGLGPSQARDHVYSCGNRSIRDAGSAMFLPYLSQELNVLFRREYSHSFVGIPFGSLA
jgi:hypothetical protein